MAGSLVPRKVQDSKLKAGMRFSALLSKAAGDVTVQRSSIHLTLLSPFSVG